MQQSKVEDIIQSVLPKSARASVYNAESKEENGENLPSISEQLKAVAIA